MLDIDEIDKRILRLLQKDNKMTNAALAEKVNLSAPACLKRVKQLHASGVIEKSVAILNPHLMGEGIVIIVEIEMERDRRDMNEQFIKRINTSPEVTQCYQVTGEVDFVLIVNVANMRMFKDFANRVLYGESNMRKFKTLISMTRNKFSTEIAL